MSTLRSACDPAVTRPSGWAHSHGPTQSNLLLGVSEGYLGVSPRIPTLALAWSSS